MSDYKVDSIQVGSIRSAISESVDSELIFKDSKLPQGVSLSNLVSDISYAQQIQSNVDAYLDSALDLAVTNISAGVESIGEANTNDITSISGSLYNGVYENYLINNSTLASELISLNNVNNFKNNVGINKETPESQFNVKNNTDYDIDTAITIENKYPNVVGDPNTTYNEYKSKITQLNNELSITNKSEGTVKLSVDSSNITFNSGLTINDFEIISNNIFKLDKVSIDGSTQVTTTTGGSAIVSSTNGFGYLKEGSIINVDGQVRYVDKINSNSEIEVVSISGDSNHTIDASNGKSFTFQNPLLLTNDCILNANDNLGFGTKIPTSRVHIKDKNSIFLEHENPEIFFGNKEDTYGKISYNFTTDPLSTEGFSLDISSSKLGKGSSIKLSSVSNSANSNSTPSGEIEFYTSPYTYETSSDEELRMSINTYGNVGINENNPISKVHVSEDVQTLTGTISISAGSNTIKGSSVNDQMDHETEFTKQLGVGDKVIIHGQTRTITNIEDDYTITCDVAFVSGGSHLVGEVLPAIARLDNDSSNVFRVEYDGSLITQDVSCSSINILGDVTTVGNFIGNGSELTNIVKKHVEQLGDNSVNTFNINHNLNTEDFTISIKNNTTKQLINPDTVTIVDANNISVTTTLVPNTNEYSVIIIG